MTDILTVTLNPALDISAATDRVRPGPKLRLDEPVTEPGGGGINVARAAVKLGGAARAIAALGGLTGARFAAVMAGSGVDLVVFPAPGETRQSLAVTDRGDGGQYRMQFPGPVWDASQAAAILDLIAIEAGRIGPRAVVVLSGSQPPGMSAMFAQELARRLGDARLIIDTSGPALQRLVTTPARGQAPHVLRMDRAESEGLAGQTLPDPAASLDFAQSLVRADVADCVILARGAEGSVLATRDLRLLCRPPVVAVVSAIGAGDSFTAGFALALARGGDWAEALLRGTAAAAAAVMTPGSELCRADTAARIAPACMLTRA